MNKKRFKKARQVFSLVLLFILTIQSLGTYAQEKNQEQGKNQKFVAEEFIVQFKPGIASAARNKIHEQNEVAVKESIVKLDILVLKVPKGKTVLEMVEIYKKNPNIEFAEPNYILESTAAPNDPYYKNWQGGLTRLEAAKAWDIHMGSSAITIAVLDTGVKLDHEDLKEKIMKGYDFVNNDGDPNDDHGHGTRVAGILGASTNNNIGIAGVAWLNPIMPVKVLGADGSGSHSNIAKGIIYAADHGARVINMSLGGSTGSATLKNAVDYAYGKKVVLVAAAGNSNSAVFYPAAYNNVIAVAAVDNNDLKANYSCYGPEISVTAPGTVMSTVRGGGYGSGSGTSFAAPFVSGLAGLILSVDSQLQPDEVEVAIEKGAQDIGEVGKDHYYGWGIINLHNSLSFLRGPAAAPLDTIPPVITLMGEENIAVLLGQQYTDPGATAVDDVDGEITGKIVVMNSVNTNTAGSYTVTYNVTDQAGNHAVELRRTVHVNEPVVETPPTPEPEPISQPKNMTLNGSLGDKKVGSKAVHEIQLGREGAFEALLEWNTRNCDLDFYLYDASDNLIASSSASKPSLLEEGIGMSNLTPQRYKLEVVAVSGKTSYSIKILLP